MSFIVFWLMDLSQQTCHIFVFKSLLAESHVGLHIYSKIRHMTSASGCWSQSLFREGQQRHFQPMWSNCPWSSCRAVCVGQLLLKFLPLFSPLIRLLPARSVSTWNMFSSSQSYIIHKTHHECLSLFWQHMFTASRSSCSFLFQCYVVLHSASCQSPNTHEKGN